MLRRILSRFGFVKIPAEAVALSAMNALYLDVAVDTETNPEMKAIWQRMAKTQRTLTDFLQSGRLEPKA